MHPQFVLKEDHSPTFTGSSDEDIDEYLEMFEEIADSQGWADTKKLMELRLHLKGKALLWLRVQKTEDKKSYCTLKERLLQKFRTIGGATESLFMAMLACKQQRGEDADSYVYQKLLKIKRYEVAKGDTIGQAATVAYIHDGLLPHLQISVNSMVDHCSVDQLLTALERAERQRATRPSVTAINECSKCGRRNHSTKDCRAHIKCTTCAKFGHHASACRQQPTTKWRSKPSPPKFAPKPAYAVRPTSPTASDEEEKNE